jgi:CubicO group peptidase (beta-lactamase class C family)
MKKYFLLTIVFALFTIPSKSAFSQYSLQDKLNQLDELFADWDSSITPGCAVGVSEQGRTIVNRAWGMADLELSVPNTPATIFEAGSVSKQFTGAAVILLALDGKLSLDDDVRTHISEMPDYGDVITLRHLLTHTSGLRDWGAVTSISGWGRANRTHNHDHVLDLLSRQTRLNFTPGERYSYSNSGYNLLAVVVERVSGMSFADFSTKYIFEPLGMTSTQWRDDYTRIVPGRSSAYSGSSNSETFSINRPIEHVHGNGGLLTTVGDLLTWSYALSSGYFGDEFYRELTTAKVLNNGRTIDYASGVRLGIDHGQNQVVHTGATSGYRAYLSIFPEQELAVALLCNVTGASPGALGSGISKIYLGENAKEIEPTVPEGVTLRERDLRSKTGIWVDSRNHRTTVIELEDGKLKLQNGTKLIPKSASEFYVGSSDVIYRFTEGGDSGRPSIRIVREGYEEELLVPVNAVADNSNRSLYTGIFQSRDAETVITIREKDGKLMAHRRPNDVFELEPVYEDAFLARGFGLIRFVSTVDGEPAQFVYSSGRVYDLRFNRVSLEDAE